MEEMPSYIIVRDADVDALADTVNERIGEGYELAGPLVCVPAAGGQPPAFLQPMTLAAAEEEEQDGEEEDDEDEDESYDDEDEDVGEESDATEDVVVYRRRR